ncbi:MAG: hypothetical protein M3Y53_08555, partial [Thermoproteota archaeon]|nr:hypothetical protein [Thermoproteota archaeon]
LRTMSPGRPGDNGNTGRGSSGGSDPHSSNAITDGPYFQHKSSQMGNSSLNQDQQRPRVTKFPWVDD